MAGLVPISLFSIPSGHKIVIMHKWDAGDAINLIAREKARRGFEHYVVTLLHYYDDIYSCERNNYFTSR